jgi:4-amino-4-deoxychorismate lyase
MLINGQKTTKIDARDRAIAYGDGLFSTIKVENGVVSLWALHLKRLQKGTDKLFFPDVDWKLLEAEVIALALTVAKKRQAVLKVILSRGIGGRGYSTLGCDSVVRILSLHDFPTVYPQWQAEGIDLIACDHLLSNNKQLAGLKTLNRLEQILIKQEIESKDALDGIVCDQNGYAIEACAANIFIYKDDAWLTPKLDTAGVEGVMREAILQAARKRNIKIEEVHLYPQDILKAETLCLTNSLMGIIPVNRYQAQCYDKFKQAKNIKQLQLLIDAV